jgi:hypothetical protein
MRAHQPPPDSQSIGDCEQKTFSDIANVPCVLQAMPRIRSCEGCANLRNCGSSERGGYGTVLVAELLIVAVHWYGPLHAELQTWRRAHALAQSRNSPNATGAVCQGIESNGRKVIGPLCGSVGYRFQP